MYFHTVEQHNQSSATDERKGQVFRSVPLPNIFIKKEIGFSSVCVYNGLHTMIGPKSTGQNTGGQEESFLAAFEEYSDALFRHSRLRISDREKALDLVHDTFTKAWSYIRRGYEVDSFRPFLYKILNNLIIDEYRRKKESSLDELLEGEGVDEGRFDDLVDNTSDSLSANIDGRQALDLLETLPDKYREVIVLRFVDGLGPKEIAELIEETENVVSVRLHRGLKTLREYIEKKENEKLH